MENCISVHFFKIPKHFDDFENLRKGLTIQYPGTVLPTLSSSILSSFLEPNTTERTVELEEFLRFIALTPKLATSHVTLEFLGLNEFHVNSSRIL